MVDHFVLFPAIMATRSGALELARYSGLLSKKDVAGDGWNNIAPLVSSLQSEAYRRFSSFKQNHFSHKEVDVFDRKSMPPVLTRSVWESLGMFGSRFFRPHKGKLTSATCFVCNLESIYNLLSIWNYCY
jgi:hypothetical protein